MDDLYHEKQKLLLCGLCAVNNLLQNKAYSQETMNEIANQLPNVTNSFFNQHSSFLNIGNYSADLLIKVLELKGKKVIYFDKRKPENLKTIIQDNRVLGLLLNRVQKGFLITSNHWLTILQYNKKWYNLDSKLKEKICFKSCDDLIDFIKKELQHLTIFIVYEELYCQIIQPDQQNHEKQQIDILQEQIDDKQQKTNNEINKIEQQLDKIQLLDNPENINNNQQQQTQN